MSATETNANLFVKIAIVLIISTVVVYSLIAMRIMLVPLAFSFLLAIIIYQCFIQLERWGLGRVWTIIICVVVATMLVGGFITFIYVEIVVSIKTLLHSSQL